LPQRRSSSRARAPRGGGRERPRAGPPAATTVAGHRAPSHDARALLDAPRIGLAAIAEHGRGPIAPSPDARALFGALAAEHARITALHDEHVRTQTELHERFLAARASALSALSAALGSSAMRSLRSHEAPPPPLAGEGRGGSASSERLAFRERPPPSALPLPAAGGGAPAAKSSGVATLAMTALTKSEREASQARVA